MPTTYPIRPLKTPAPASKRPKASQKPAPVSRLTTRTGQGGDGIACVQNIVANDRQTHVYLVQALYYREQARRAGRTNAAASATLDKTVASYVARQQKLRTSKLLRANTGLTGLAKSWLAKLKSVVSGPGVGILPAIPAGVAAVVMGVVIVGTAAACWALFSPDESKSAADVQTAFQASDIYRGMSPEEQQASSQAIEQAGKGGYNDGKDAADNSLFGQLKTVALVLGGGYLFTQLLGNRRKGG
ncbi:hypothetical protein [Hymenobacter cheonanensis]|uniref:hypothetical protein n=1 Tax=Hymenobacter sp. CA2-7 TaxID=3063993 RepID=UPI002712ED4C|nr:hypothetical protein [Hymenobacter sp. CA2-7]MDO7886833.1 hypothetical protein [Hymenobacter sp. CA2-7]